MGSGGIIIPRNPRRVVLEAVSSAQVDEEDQALFNECMQKADTIGWTEAEAHFMLKHLKKNWHE